MKLAVVKGEPVDKSINRLLRETVRRRVYACKIRHTGRAPAYHVAYSCCVSGKQLRIAAPVWTLEIKYALDVSYVAN